MIRLASLHIIILLRGRKGTRKRSLLAFGSLRHHILLIILNHENDTLLERSDFDLGTPVVK